MKKQLKTLEVKDAKAIENIRQIVGGYVISNTKPACLACGLNGTDPTKCGVTGISSTTGGLKIKAPNLKTIATMKGRCPE